MATSTQESMARTLQQFLTEQYPTLDWSVGTVLYDLLIKPASVTFSAQANTAEEIRANLSLYDVLNSDNPNAELVDALLSNYNVVRKEGQTATGTILIYTESEQNVFIPEGALFTCNEIEIQPIKSYVGVFGDIVEEDTDEIAYIQMREIGNGTRVFAITAETIEAMETVLSAGLPCDSSLGNTRITAVETGSSFTGGSLQETTDELLERAQSGVNATVVTGRDNIRQLLRNQTEVNVIDADVFGMGDPLQFRDAVNNAGVSSGGRLDVYVKTAPIPIVTEAPLTGYKTDGVWSIEIPADSYPGAAGVQQITYGDTLINTGITHVLGYDPQGPWPLIESALQARYSKYQTLTVQFETDAVDPSLDEVDFVVSIIHMPGVGTLQEYLNDPAIRSHAFDHVVKGVVPVVIDVDVDIEYTRGAVVPTVGAIQQAISDNINRKLISAEALYTSDVVYACGVVFSEGTVRMPINLRARIYMPDGSVQYTSSQNYIKAPTATGISFENSTFSCFPVDVNITLSEVLV
jgi:hypothetical protein